MKQELLYRLIILLGIISVFFIFPMLIHFIKKTFKQIEINRLKNEGLKIPVDLRKCSFIEYPNRIKKGTIYKEIFDRVLLNKPQDYYERTFIETKLDFVCVVNDKKCRFISEKISVDSVSLKFLFDKHKETIIYVDKENMNHYYFDLEFIK